MRRSFIYATRHYERSNEMNKTDRLLMKDIKVLKKYGFDVYVEKSKHVKTIISLGGIEHKIISPSSPSDIRGRNQIATIRNVLRDKYGKDSKSSDFSIEFVKSVRE